MPSSSRSNSPGSDARYLPPVSQHTQSPTRQTDDSPLPQSPTPSNLRGSPTPSSGTNSTPGIKKRHICPTCQKSFTTSGHLSRHSRVHTGERNHKCPFPGCETRCSRQDNLQQHYRIHLSPGSRRTSGSSTRSALARALGADGSGVRKRGSKYAVFTPPPPPPESPPSTPPPLVQAYPALANSLDSSPLTSSHAVVPISIPPVHDFHSDGSSSSPDSRYESESPLVPSHSDHERRSSSYTGSFTQVTGPSFEQPSGNGYSYYPESHPMSRGTYHSQCYSGYSTSNLAPAPVPVPSQRGSIHGSSGGEHVLLQSTSASFTPSQHYSHPSYPASHTPSDSPSPASSHYSSYGSTQSSAEYSMHSAMDQSPLVNTRGVYGSSHHSRVGYSAGARYSSPMPGVSHLHGHYPSTAPSEMV